MCGWFRVATVAALSRRSRRRHGPRGPALVTLALPRPQIPSLLLVLFGANCRNNRLKGEIYFGTCPDLGPKCSCLGLAYPTGIVRACRIQRACLGI